MTRPLTSRTCVCGAPISRDFILCRRDWFRVPNDLRQKVWRLYSSARGSVEHLRAIAEARAWVRANPYQTDASTQ